MRIGIAGFGNVGRDVARRLLAGAIPEAELVAVSAARLDLATSYAATLSPSLKVLPIPGLINHADVIVECATVEAFPDIARAVVSNGKHLIALSAYGVANCPDLIELARRYGGSVTIANGVLPGLDIIRSAREGTISAIRLTSRLRPDSVASEPFILERYPDLPRAGMPPLKVFEGTAAAAADAFPRHFNVAVTLSLGGIGPERTQVEVWCDPDIAGAVHRVDVEAAEISLTMISRNVPSAIPRTSQVVALSVLAALRSLTAPIRLGS
jgi:aspartate dehydrogenase